MTPREPERLRLSASEVERRALAQAAGEVPPPEVIGRVARALGVSAAAVDAATKASAGGTSVATAKASAGAGAGANISTAATIPWVSVGVLGVVVAGAIVGVGMWRSTSPSPSSPAPTVMPQAPAVASLPEQQEQRPAPGETPAAVTAQAPGRVASPPTAPRRAREAAPLPDSRAQTYLVDSARNALAAGSADRALVLLARYREKYANGIFLPEVVVLKIEALARLGRSNEAQALAARFAADYGEGPLAERARRVAELPKP